MDLPCLENGMGMQIGDEELPYERRITMAVMNGMNGESVHERGAGWIPVAKTRQHRQRALRPKSSIDIRQAVNGYANERNPGGRGGTPSNLLAGNPDTGVRVSKLRTKFRIFFKFIISIIDENCRKDFKILKNLEF